MSSETEFDMKSRTVIEDAIFFLLVLFFFLFFLLLVILQGHRKIEISPK